MKLFFSFLCLISVLKAVEPEEHYAQLDPALKALMVAMAKAPAALNEIPLDIARTIVSESFASPEELCASVGRVEERSIPVKEGEIKLRLYFPESEGPHPCVLFYHHGGFVFGDLDSGEIPCRRFCKEWNAVVVNVDYRLAPEFPYPTPLEDSFAALLWTLENAEELGIDPAKISVAGESAGGNLAAGVAMKARGEGICLAAQYLFYPVLDSELRKEDYESCLDQHFVTYDLMKWFWKQYLQESGRGREAFAAPVYAEDLSGLAPAFIATAEHDGLKYEAERYGQKLRAAGVPVIQREYSNIMHGFLSLPFKLTEAERAYEDAFNAYR